MRLRTILTIALIIGAVSLALIVYKIYRPAPEKLRGGPLLDRMYR